MVCEMELSRAGKPSKIHFTRLSFTPCPPHLHPGGRSAGKGAHRTSTSVACRPETPAALYKVLRAARDKRGAIDFETGGNPHHFQRTAQNQAIVPVIRNDAHKLIGGMLSANVAAADFFEANGVPMLYRARGPHRGKSWRTAKFSASWAWTWPAASSPRPALPATAATDRGARGRAH